MTRTMSRVYEMECEVSMSASVYVLRTTPLLLPILAIVSAVVGLAMRLGMFPSIDNVVFVAYATLISGIAPTCLILGVVLLVIDMRWPLTRPVIYGLAGIIACTALVGGYLYGRGLDF